MAPLALCKLFYLAYRFMGLVFRFAARTSYPTASRTASVTRRTADTELATPPLAEAPAFLSALESLSTLPDDIAMAPQTAVFAGSLAAEPAPTGAYSLTRLAGRTGLDPALFYDPAYTPVLERLVALVVATEAPLRPEALVNRVARAHGFQQSGRLIRERLTGVIAKQYAVLPDPDGVSFVWPNAEAAMSWDRYRLPAGEDDVRWIDEIPMAELRALGLTLPVADRAVEVARRFGVRRVTGQARTRIDAACAMDRADASAS